LSRPAGRPCRAPVSKRLTPNRRAAMQSIRTPFLEDDQVQAGFTPIRVEITEVDGKIVFETVWAPPAESAEPIQPEDVPY